jgi:hypothetical protein
MVLMHFLLFKLQTACRQNHASPEQSGQPGVDQANPQDKQARVPV